MSMGLLEMPAPEAVPATYDRRRPSLSDQGDLVRSIVARHDWARLSWGELVAALAGIGRTDIVTARLAEGHVDAVRIAGEAGGTLRPGALYGVWASRSHATGVAAAPRAGRLILNGTLRFASGAGLLDRALVPVWTDPDTHLLADLDVRGLPESAPAWSTPAMAASRSRTLLVEDMDIASDAVIGDANFYLERPGFFAGGIGVAAVWCGAAARVVDCCIRQLGGAPPSAHRQRRLGRMRADLAVAVALVTQAAQALDHPAGADRGSRELATLVRAGVADAVERILGDGRVMAGAAGIAFDEELDQSLLDLGLYVLQRNADADAEWLGGMVLDSSE